MNSINFFVTYQLGEYRATTLEHWTATAFKSGDLLDPNSKVLPLPVRWYIFAVSTAAFFYKVSKVGVCEFTIDDTGIKRKCKSGEGTLPWNKVTAIHTCKFAWLVAMSNGALMLPFRCMTQKQVAILTALIARRQEELSVA